jgi:hypothetical protein
MRGALYGGGHADAGIALLLLFTFALFADRCRFHQVDDRCCGRHFVDRISVSLARKEDTPPQRQTNAQSTRFTTNCFEHESGNGTEARARERESNGAMRRL